MELCESPLDWPGVHAARPLVHGEPLEGYWFNRSAEWSARNRGQEVGAYDFATRYLVELAPLPAFRHLSPEEYREKVEELVREIEEEGERQRDGRSVAGVEKILSLNPYEPPTRQTKRSPRPLFHAASREIRNQLRDELSGFLVQYWEASEILRNGKRLRAAEWFPEGCYPPALPFNGSPPTRRPPSPPTRRISVLESGKVERGEIPVVVIRIGLWPGECEGFQTAEPRARGEPP